jgi:hypothetical protein
MVFNVEEMNLLFMFDTSSKEAAIQDILNSLPNMADEELREICQQAVRKLETMTNKQFEELDFTMYDKEDMDYAE